MARAPRHRWTTATILAASAAGLPGCQMFTREQVEDCRKVSQTLRTENVQLKDQVLALRSQNQDFSERAVEDGRRLTRQDEAIGRLEKSVHAYQEERSRLEDAFKDLRANLPTTTRGLSARLGDRLEELAGRLPDCQLDRDRGAISIPASILFKGSDDLDPTSRRWLEELASALLREGPDEKRVSVTSRVETPSLLLTSWDANSTERSLLAFKQASRVRSILASKLPSTAMETSVSMACVDAPDGGDRGRGRGPDSTWIVIRMEQAEPHPADDHADEVGDEPSSSDEDAPGEVQAAENKPASAGRRDGWMPAKAGMMKGNRSRDTSRTDP